MSRSYRSIILAAIGWLILCGAQPPANQTQSANGGKQPSEPDRPPLSRTPVMTPTHATIPRITTPPICAPNGALLSLLKKQRESLIGETGLPVLAAMLPFVSILLVLVTLREARIANALQFPPDIYVTNASVWKRGMRGRIPP